MRIRLRVVMEDNFPFQYRLPVFPRKLFMEYLILRITIQYRMLLHSICGIGTTIFQIEIRLPGGVWGGRFVVQGGTLLYCQNVFTIETDC